MAPDEELLPMSPPISLPYPSLVTSPPSRSVQLPPVSSSSRTYQVPLSDGSTRTGRSATGFFASIGRRASLKKGSSPPSPPRMLSKKTLQPSASPPVRPIQIQSSPAVRGGPRAPPNRIQRAKTFSVAAQSPPERQPQPPPQVSLTRSETTNTRTSITSRRPSLFHRSVAPTPPSPPIGPEFEEQLDKLTDLLPHADRDVLAGYLRRAKQDILAIGQYLEDEKNGTLRCD